MNIILKVQQELSKIEKQIVVMESYLDLKRQDRDWHGVWDAAIDIKSLEDKRAVLQNLKVAWLVEVAKKQEGEAKDNAREPEKQV